MTDRAMVGGVCIYKVRGSNLCVCAHEMCACRYYVVTIAERLYVGLCVCVCVCALVGVKLHLRVRCQ